MTTGPRPTAAIESSPSLYVALQQKVFTVQHKLKVFVAVVWARFFSFFLFFFLRGFFRSRSQKRGKKATSMHAGDMCMMRGRLRCESDPLVRGPELTRFVPHRATSRRFA